MTNILTTIITAVLTSILAFLVQERRLRRDFRLEFMAEQAASELLQSEHWRKRSLTALKGRLGGFGDDELRKILVRAGAVRFEGNQGEEYWGLLSRNKGEV